MNQCSPYLLKTGGLSCPLHGLVAS